MSTGVDDVRRNQPYDTLDGPNDGEHDVVSLEGSTTQGTGRRDSPRGG